MLCIGSERYTPYLEKKYAQELLTISNHVLGFGQMSLAKYLFIVDFYDNKNLDINNKKEYFKNFLKRVDWQRDIHFHTKTSIDTLDYSSKELNFGSKVVFTSVGKKKNKLGTKNINFKGNNNFYKCSFVIDGIICIEGQEFIDYKSEIKLIKELLVMLDNIDNINQFPLIVIVDDCSFVSKSFSNFLWVTFTRSNPSHDIYGINEKTEFKHWSCEKSLVIDARKKPHHAPELIKDQKIEKKVDELFSKVDSLKKFA